MIDHAHHEPPIISAIKGQEGQVALSRMMALACDIVVVAITTYTHAACPPEAAGGTMGCEIAQVQKAVERLIAIWDDRKVFGLSGAKPFKELIAAAETPRKALGVLHASSIYLTPTLSCDCL